MLAHILGNEAKSVSPYPVRTRGESVAFKIAILGEDEQNPMQPDTCFVSANTAVAAARLAYQIPVDSVRAGISILVEGGHGLQSQHLTPGTEVNNDLENGFTLPPSDTM